MRWHDNCVSHQNLTIDLRILDIHTHALKCCTTRSLAKWPCWFLCDSNNARSQPVRELLAHMSSSWSPLFSRTSCFLSISFEFLFFRKLADWQNFPFYRFLKQSHRNSYINLKNSAIKMNCLVVYILLEKCTPQSAERIENATNPHKFFKYYSIHYTFPLFRLFFKFILFLDKFLNFQKCAPKFMPSRYNGCSAIYFSSTLN